MILLGQWLDPEERPLPSEAEQITFIEQAERDVYKRQLVVGVSPELEFMCCFCTQDDIAEYYSEAMSSSEYLEIMELYADRLKGQIAAVQAQRNTLHIPLDMLGREHCFCLLYTSRCV